MALPNKNSFHDIKSSLNILGQPPFENLAPHLNGSGLNLIPTIIKNPHRLMLTEAADQAGSLFSGVLALKARGYSNKIGENILPLDQYDFICDHVSLCEKRGNLWIPHLSFKTISLARCREYGLPFPFLEKLKRSSRPEAVDQVGRELASEEAEGKSVFYNGSLTASPTLFSNPVLGPRIKSLIAMLFLSFHENTGTNSVYSLALTKFKIDRLMAAAGAKPLTKFFPNLPDCILQLPDFNDHDSVPMRLQLSDLSSDARFCIRSNKSLWDSRVSFEVSTPSTIKRAA